MNRLAEYLYLDTQGEATLRKVRWDGAPKFTWEHLDEGGAWRSGKGGKTALLYNTPRLLNPARHHDVIFFCEGEKDADRLTEAGLLATSRPETVSWSDAWLPLLAGRLVAILQDFDKTGLTESRKLLEHVAPVARAVVRVPVLCMEDVAEARRTGVPDGEILERFKGHDVSDWLNEGNDVAHLERYACTLLLATLNDRVTDDGHRVWSISDLYRDEALVASRGLVAANEKDSGILAPGTACVLAGPQGVGKTYAALHLLTCIPEGQPFGPYLTRRARTMLLSEEMQASRMRQRLRTVFSEDDVRRWGASVDFMCRTDLRLDSDIGATRLRRMIELAGTPGLVAIDAMVDVKGILKENENDDMGALLRTARKVAEDTGACLLVLHHYGKPSEHREGINLVRGASAIKDVAADVIGMFKTKAGAREGEFLKTRDSDMEGRKWQLTMTPGEDGRMRLAVIAAEENAEAIAIAAVVRAEVTIMRADLLEALGKRFGWSASTSKRRIKEALEDDLIEAEDFGKSVRYSVAQEEPALVEEGGAVGF